MQDDSEARSEPCSKSSSTDSMEKITKVEVLQIIDQPDLIQPDQVVVTQEVVVERADPILTPLGEFQ